MPMMQSVVERLNTRFNRDNIDQVDPGNLAPPASGTAEAGRETLLTGARAVERSPADPTAIGASTDETNYIAKNFPAADLEKLRDVLHWAVSQPARVPVQFLWVPAAQAKIEYWHVAALAGSMPGISVLIQGPTPAPVISNSHP